MGNVVQTLIMVVMLIAFGQTGKTDTLDKNTLAFIWRAQVQQHHLCVCVPHAEPLSCQWLSLSFLTAC